MTRRFFYTDPLAASWMAKHFDMEFIDPITGRIEPSDIGTALFSRGYIHSDSLPLLGPRIGDGVEFDRWFFERRRNAEYKDYPYQPHYARVNAFGRADEGLAITSAGVCWDDTSEAPGFTLPLKIIQRNGIPFMWPESEEA